MGVLPGNWGQIENKKDRGGHTTAFSAGLGSSTFSGTGVGVCAGVSSPSSVVPGAMASTIWVAVTLAVPRIPLT